MISLSLERWLVPQEVWWFSRGSKFGLDCFLVEWTVTQLTWYPLSLSLTCHSLSYVPVCPFIFTVRSLLEAKQLQVPQTSRILAKWTYFLYNVASLGALLNKWIKTHARVFWQMLQSSHHKKGSKNQLQTLSKWTRT